jgi:hypothetical protein
MADEDPAPFLEHKLLWVRTAYIGVRESLITCNQVTNHEGHRDGSVSSVYELKDAERVITIPLMLTIFTFWHQ